MFFTVLEERPELLGEEEFTERAVSEVRGTQAGFDQRRSGRCKVPGRANNGGRSGGAEETSEFRVDEEQQGRQLRVGGGVEPEVRAD